MSTGTLQNFCVTATCVGNNTSTLHRTTLFISVYKSQHFGWWNRNPSSLDMMSSYCCRACMDIKHASKLTSHSSRMESTLPVPIIILKHARRMEGSAQHGVVSKLVVWILNVFLWFLSEIRIFLPTVCCLRAAIGIRQYMYAITGKYIYIGGILYIGRFQAIIMKNLSRLIFRGFGENSEAPRQYNQ